MQANLVLTEGLSTIQLFEKAAKNYVNHQHGDLLKNTIMYYLEYFDNTLTEIERFVRSCDYNTWVLSNTDSQPFTRTHPFICPISKQIRTQQEFADNCGLFSFSRTIVWGMGYFDLKSPELHERNTGGTGNDILARVNRLINGNKLPSYTSVHKLLQTEIKTLSEDDFNLARSILLQLWIHYDFMTPLDFKEDDLLKDKGDPLLSRTNNLGTNVDSDLQTSKSVQDILREFKSNFSSDSQSLSPQSDLAEDDNESELFQEDQQIPGKKPVNAQQTSHNIQRVKATPTTGSYTPSTYGKIRSRMDLSHRDESDSSEDIENSDNDSSHSNQLQLGGATKKSRSSNATITTKGPKLSSRYGDNDASDAIAKTPTQKITSSSSSSSSKSTSSTSSAKKKK